MCPSNIMVIGGSGFIGSSLFKHFFNIGKKLLKLLIENEVNYFPDSCLTADVRNFDKLEKCIYEKSLIINLAAEHQDNVFPLPLYDGVNFEFGGCNIDTRTHFHDFWYLLVELYKYKLYLITPLGLK
jgi:nucleoside-diphosphate-sugar epimerase